MLTKEIINKEFEKVGTIQYNTIGVEVLHQIATKEEAEQRLTEIKREKEIKGE